jgi:integrase
MRTTIGLVTVRKLKPGEKIWDSKVRGFHARRQKGDTVRYVLFYRTADGRSRWYTIGEHGSPWTPDTARDEAKRLLGAVVDGSDPAADKHSKRTAETVGALCDLYLADIESGRALNRNGAPKKQTTVGTDRGRILRHIKPLLGRLSVAAVTRDDVDQFMHDVAAGKTAGDIKTANKFGKARVRGGKGTASRTVGLLGSIFSYAVSHRMRADNPVRGVRKFAEGKRERRLTDAEYRMLGDALEKGTAARVWPSIIAAGRFLALTGWRSGEAMALRWDEIDIDRRTATLSDTKTGKSVRPLSHAACNVLRSLTKAGDLVFPSIRGTGPMTGYSKLWAHIVKLGKLPPAVTPHTLRHSFASLAGDLGYSEPTIAALVGHKGRSITSRYVRAHGWR